MALTLTQATTEVRDHLNEATAEFWTDAQIQKWIQEGTRMVSGKAFSVEADDTITLVTNQLTYTSSDESFIADCIEPIFAYYDDGSNNYKGLIKVVPREIGNVATFTAGDPKYYCLFNRTFYIWPLPSSTTNGNTIMVLYAKETDDITELKDEHQHMAIMWAIAKCKFRDRAFGEAAAIMNNFYQELSFERADKSNREVDIYQGFKIQEGQRGARA